jgi:hypothetical protein
MSNFQIDDIPRLYSMFNSPIANIDCGNKCASYNELAVPFCCDTNHAVPTAYLPEWEYLKSNTDLWHQWEAVNPSETTMLMEQTPECQILIECLGYKFCQREFRSLTCRSFPFFPYLTSSFEFIGFTYYWDYDDRCWVINNLEKISDLYRSEFFKCYDKLFELQPDEIKNFHYQSSLMRSKFTKLRRSIPLLHRNKKNYKVSPRSERMRLFSLANLPKHGPYKWATILPFPDD